MSVGLSWKMSILKWSTLLFSDACYFSFSSFRLEQCEVYNSNNFKIEGVPKDVKWIPKYTNSKSSRSLSLFLSINLGGDGRGGRISLSLSTADITERSKQNFALRDLVTLNRNYRGFLAVYRRDTIIIGKRKERSISGCTCPQGVHI